MAVKTLPVCSKAAQAWLSANLAPRLLKIIQVLFYFIFVDCGVSFMNVDIHTILVGRGWRRFGSRSSREQKDPEEPRPPLLHAEGSKTLHFNHNAARLQLHFSGLSTLKENMLFFPATSGQNFPECRQQIRPPNGKCREGCRRLCEV